MSWLGVVLAIGSVWVLVLVCAVALLRAASRGDEQLRRSIADFTRPVGEVALVKIDNDPTEGPRFIRDRRARAGAGASGRRPLAPDDGDGSS